jgi:carboxymethylenebutenolidase
MRCFVAVPEETPAAAVVVIQHAGGVDQFVQTMTRRLGEAGFVAIAPDLYHRDDPNSSDDPLTRMSRLRDKNIIEDVGAAVAHVRSLPEAAGQRTGITGFCMGGRVTYLMAGAMPDAFSAGVVFYGGNIMVPWGQGDPPFALTGRIEAPLLGLFGEDDGNPNPADVAKIDAELSRLGKTHEFHSYKGAGHAFMNEGRPSHREDAANDAWARCIGWFEKYLGQAEG